MPTIYSHPCKKYIYSLDVLRIIASLFVFLFHCNLRLSVSFGALNPLISQGAIFMVMFFILSGFSLYYKYSESNLLEITNLKHFYLKRILSIYPLYLTVHILYSVFLDNLSISQILTISPIEILLLQSFFDTLYPISHNGGTWFISCIMVCYLLFPFFSKIIVQLRRCQKILLIIILYFISCISPVIASLFHLNWVYPKPFFRLLEFVIGILICSFFLQPKSKAKGSIIISYLFIEYSLLCASIYTMSKLSLGSYASYNFITIPIFCLIIYHSSQLNIKPRRLITFLSKLTFPFYLSQLFTWAPSGLILNHFNIRSNISAMVISFFVCFFISIYMYILIEKILKTFLQHFSC